MFYTDEIRQIIEQTKKTITLEDVKNGDCFVHSNRKIYRVVYDKEKQDKLVLTYEPKKDGSYVLKKIKETNCAGNHGYDRYYATFYDNGKQEYESCNGIEIWWWQNGKIKSEELYITPTDCYETPIIWARWLKDGKYYNEEGQQTSWVHNVSSNRGIKEEYKNGDCVYREICGKDVTGKMLAVKKLAKWNIKPDKVTKKLSKPLKALGYVPTYIAANFFKQRDY